MQANRSRIVKLLAVSVVLAMAAAACGSDDDDTRAEVGHDQARPGGRPSTARAPRSRRPSTRSPSPSYKEVQPGVTVNYAGGGSGTGRQNLQDGVVDFAGSDGLVKEEDKAKYKGEFLYVPTVAAPITVSYNLTGVKDLVLDADTIAKIFQRQITKWDDPAIKALQPRRQPAVDRHHRRPPLRRLGHHRELHQVPGRGGARHLDAEVGLHRRVAGRHPGRQRQRRAWPRSSRTTDGRHRLRRPLRRQGHRPPVRQGQEQGGQGGGADPRRRLRRPGRSHGQPRPAPTTRSTPRAPTPTPSPPRPGSSSTRTRPTRPRATPSRASSSTS